MTGEDARRRLLEVLEFQSRFDSRLVDIDNSQGFDGRYGVDTDAPVETWEIAEADEVTLEHNSRYSPTPVRTIRRVIESCPVVHEEVSFVDFGCGKGRVLLAASAFPFRSVQGVEFSARLCDTARSNLRRYRSAGQRCHELEVHHADAVDFEIPADAGICYFYEPFSTDVTERVVANIETSIREHPRQVVLCFVGRGRTPAQGESVAGTVRSAVMERPLWRQLGDVVASPDDEFYDAWLYTNGPCEK